MNCRAVRNLTSAYLEEEVTAEERYGIEGHLQKCVGCSTTLFQASRVLSLLRNLPRVPSTPDFTDRVTTSLHDAAFTSGRLYPKKSILQIIINYWDLLPSIRIPSSIWAPGVVAAGILVAVGGIKDLSSTGSHVRTTIPHVVSSQSAGQQPVERARQGSAQMTASRSTLSSPKRTVSVQVTEATRTNHRIRRNQQNPQVFVSKENPLADTDVIGPNGFVPSSHDLLEPTQIDLVVDRISADRAGLLQRTGTSAPSSAPPRRRYWTF
jgi:hypothetical protein